MCLHAVPFQLESLPTMIAGVLSNDGPQQLESTTQFRKLLSIGKCIRLMFSDSDFHILFY